MLHHIVLSIVTEEVTNSPPEFTQLFIKTIIMLVALLGLVVSGMWLLRRFGLAKYDIQNTKAQVSVLERRVLSPKSALWIISVDDEKFLIVDGSQGAAITQLQKRSSPTRPFSLEERYTAPPSQESLQ
jgi:flagellar biogenesis protein FliO